MESDRKTARAMALALRRESYQVQVAVSAESGSDLVTDWNPDLVLLDLDLPGNAGIELVKRFRLESDAALIAISERDTVADRVAALRGGADDYVSKPFALEELSARVEAVLRRHRSDGNDRMEAGGLELDISSATVTRAGVEVPVTATEFRILVALMRRRGKIIAADQLQDLVWPLDRSPASNSIEVHMMRLRRKIGDRRPHTLIRNVRGIGYTIPS